MRAYLMIIANCIKSTFTYRAHILFQILTSALMILVQFFIWRAVFAASPGGIEGAVVRGMSFDQTFLYVSLAAALGVLMRTWTDWDMNGQIRSGDIIMFMFKPADYMKYMFSNSIGLMAGNLISITIPSAIVIFGFFGAPLPGVLNTLFFAFALAGSCALTFLFDFIIGTTCFWTMSIWGISAGKEVIIAFLSGALIPLGFYPEALRSVMVWLPFPYMYNLPLSILTASKADPLVWAQGIGVQLVWVIVILAASRAYYRYSLRKLTVNGG